MFKERNPQLSSLMPNQFFRHFLGKSARSCARVCVCGGGERRVMNEWEMYNAYITYQLRKNLKTESVINNEIITMTDSSSYLF